MRKNLGLIIAGLVFAGFFSKSIFAQVGPPSAGVAVNIEITDTAATVGDILSIAGDNFKRSEVAYDDKIYGVIAEAPIISVEPKTDTTKAVVTSGATQVRVTNAGGAIVAGDFITSTTTAGVGQKATESGYVVGKALGSYDSGQAGLLSVEVAVGFAQIGAGNGANKGVVASIVSDPSKLRLFLAVILAILVLVGGLIAFVKLVNSGVTAIGRNPLARATIIRGMFISGSVVVVIMAMGIGAAVAVVMIGSR